MTGGAERGQVLVMAVVAMLAIVGIAALVLNLAAVRLDQRAATTAADFAAVNGAYELDPAIGGSPQAACQKAWTTLQQNMPDLPSGAGVDCTQLAAASACSSTTSAQSVQATGTGPYTIVLRTPVPDTDALMVDPSGEAPQPSHDGTSCQRFGIQVTTKRSFFFGNVTGTKSGSSTVHAVARYSLRNGDTFPALATLDPHACPSIVANSGYIEAFSATDASTGNSSPGLIYADSDGAGYTGAKCNTGSGLVVYVTGSGATTTDCSAVPTGPSGLIWAQCSATQAGVIGTYALSTSNATYAYKPGYNYFPQPTPLAQPITREPIDAIYHCDNVAASYGITCTDDYIDDLVTAYSGISTTSAGWTVLSGPTYCSPSAGYDIGPYTYVDCPDDAKGTGGLSISGVTVTLTPGSSGGPVVFAGNVNVSNGGRLLVTAPGITQGDTTLSDYASVPNTILYLQNSGSMNVSQTSTLVVLPHTFVHTGTGTGGCLNLGSGTQVVWSAVTSSSADYQKLMFWSEGSCNVNGVATASTFNGGPSLTMDGILFSPNANWVATGGSVVDARNVQFWVNTVSVSGNGTGLLLRPDPNNSIPVAGAVALIR